MQISICSSLLSGNTWESVSQLWLLLPRRGDMTESGITDLMIQKSPQKDKVTRSHHNPLEGAQTAEQKITNSLVFSRVRAEEPGLSPDLSSVLNSLKVPTPASRSQHRRPRTFSTLFLKKGHFGTSLVVQWLRLHSPKAGDPGLISGQETRSNMPQRRPGAAK